jgi:serine/threonine-protein kinase
MADQLEQLRTSIADRYEIERELGRGGMATVYLVRDLKHNRRMALKVLLPDLAVALGAERFRREIELATHLSHPHILPLYDSGVANGQLYYVMPYVEGESLRARLDRERQLPMNEAIRIATEVASALEHAHRHGIIHRDIKPENILLEDGQALVADFGIARAVSAVGEQKLTQTGVSLGTPSYMSPEQAMADRNLDGRSDVYSLGCVLYEMLAGTPPFTGPTAQAVMARHALDEVPSLTVVRGAIPDEVEDVVLQALEKVPADRFATAGEFAEALIACQHTASHRVTRGTRRVQARRRSRVGGQQSLIVRGALGALALAAVVWAGNALLSDAGSSGVARAEIPDFPISRIAVLYFDDLSSDSTLGYLADGLTESLIEQLGEVRGLDVVSTNGVSQFRGIDMPSDTIGHRLRAGTLVRGSVAPEARQVRVTMHVVDGFTGAVRGDETFVGQAGDPILLRRELAARAQSLLVDWVEQDVRLSELSAGTSNAVAWSLVLRAERLRKNAEALAHDGNVAGAAHALATADSILSVAEPLDAQWAEPIVLRARIAGTRAYAAHDPRDVLRLVREGIGHATRALAVDESDADAYYVRAAVRVIPIVQRIVHSRQEADSIAAAAEADVRGALALEKDHADALSLLSGLLYEQYDLIQAGQVALQAYEADYYLRSAPQIYWRLYSANYDAGGYALAQRWCTEGSERFPHHPNMVRCRLWILTMDNAPVEPDSAWARAAELPHVVPPHDSAFYAREGQIVAAAVIARAARRADSAAVRATLLDSARRVLVRARVTREIDPTGDLMGLEAFARTAIGDREEAIALLQKYLIEHPDHRRGFGKISMWWWQPLRGDSRFEKLVDPGG